MQVGLFNSRDYEFMARQLGVLFSYSTFECWAQVFCGGEYAHETAGEYDETADTFRTWASRYSVSLGISQAAIARRGAHVARLQSL